MTVFPRFAMAGVADAADLPTGRHWQLQTGCSRTWCPLGRGCATEIAPLDFVGWLEKRAAKNECYLPALEDVAVPTVDQVEQFMSVLEQRRATAPHDEWRALVKTSPLIKLWRFFLSMDPYTRWGLTKPRGYPGDATLMDFAYGHSLIRTHIEESGPLAARIYVATSGARQSKSIRDRVELMRHELSLRAAKGEFNAVSVAAGHARELEELPKSTRRSFLSFTAVDLDSTSLDQA